MRAIDDKSWIFLSIEKAINPPEGCCNIMKNYWWAVSPDGGLVFFKHFCSPQCNKDKTIVTRLLKKDGWDVVFMPIVYVPMDTSTHN